MKASKSRIVFQVINYTFLLFYALCAVLPLIHLGAVSLSRTSYAEAGLVGLWPRGINVGAYAYIFSNGTFFKAFGNSLLRLVTGVPLNMILTFLLAYPLARPVSKFHARNAYAWFLMVCMLFTGGTVPMYMLVSALKLNNSLFALILPGAVPVFNVVLMMNFFRALPEELHEAAKMDGAGELTIMIRIFVPLSLPSVMTLTLFCIVAQWNSWLDGVLYMSTIDKMPLQSYLQSVVINTMEGNLDSVLDTNYVSQTTIDAARLFLAVIPIILFYFPLQKYFVKGLTLGGVKG